MSATDTCLISVPGRLKAITQGVVLIEIPKALVVLDREAFVAALKKGKPGDRPRRYARGRPHPRTETLAPQARGVPDPRRQPPAVGQRAPG